MDSNEVKADVNAWIDNTIKEEVDYVKTFFNETTLHGARFLTSGNKTIRFLWVVFLCGALAFCCYYIHGISKEYMARPFTTTITRERADELEFPAVTICNLNHINKKSYIKATRSAAASVANQSNADLEKEIQLTLSLMQSQATRNVSKEANDFFINKLNTSKSYHEKGNHLLDSSKSYSHTIQGMLSLDWMNPCTWQGVPCMADNFTSFVGLKVGQCFTFNSGMPEHRKLKSSIPGPFNGLRLRLNVESDDHVSDLRTRMSGFKISIQHQNDYPLVEEFGFGLQPGTHTYAAIRQKKFQNLPAPFKTNCSSPELHFSKAYNKSYSVYVCTLQCLQEFIKQQCGCQPLLDILPGVSVCSLKDSFDCVFKNLSGPYPQSTIDCTRDCPEPCEYYQYDVKLSYTSAVGEGFLRAFPDNVISQKDHPEDFLKFNAMTEAQKREYFMKNVVSVDIYYEEISYEMSKQNEALKWESMFGTIGGYLGLFLGMSVLTVLEFVDFLFFWIFKMRSEANKNRVHSVNPC